MIASAKFHRHSPLKSQDQLAAVEDVLHHPNVGHPYGREALVNCLSQVSGEGAVVETVLGQGEQEAQGLKSGGVVISIGKTLSKTVGVGELDTPRNTIRPNTSNTQTDQWNFYPTTQATMVLHFVATRDANKHDHAH